MPLRLASVPPLRAPPNTNDRTQKQVSGAKIAPPEEPLVSVHSLGWARATFASRRCAARLHWHQRQQITAGIIICRLLTARLESAEARAPLTRALGSGRTEERSQR